VPRPKWFAFSRHIWDTGARSHYRSGPAAVRRGSATEERPGKKMTNKEFLLFAAAPFLFCAAGAVAATGRQVGSLEIMPFDVPQEIQLPADFQAALARNLVSRLAASGKFAAVFDAGTSSAGTRPAVRLTGVVTKFKKGSQAKRYLLGPGFGKTILNAHIQFVEIEAGKVLLEKDVDGKVIIGLAGGDSKGATNGLAKEVAKVAKKGL
jgi:hypothetical protein